MLRRRTKRYIILCRIKCGGCKGTSSLENFDKKKHWNKVYQGKSPVEVSWFQIEPVHSLELIKNAGIGENGYIIDVGGGASVLAERLLDEGYNNLAVLDLSAGALEHARQRLGEQARAIEWHEADITQFNPPHAYALWHDRAVFHFLTSRPDREKYISTLKSAIPPHGHIIMATFAIGGPEKCSGLDIVQYDAAKLLDVLGDEFELVEEAEEIHKTPANAEQKFSYFRLVRL